METGLCSFRIWNPQSSTVAPLKSFFLSHRKIACSKWCAVKLNGVSAVTQTDGECLNGQCTCDISCRSFVHISSSPQNPEQQAISCCSARPRFHFVALWSMVSSSFSGAEVKIHDVKKKAKQKGWAVFTHVSDHVQLRVIVGMCGCTVLHCLSFDFADYTHRDARTHTNTTVLPLSFLFCCRHTRMWLYADPLTVSEAHTPLAMFHGGLPCCLSNQRMGRFQLHWSEHSIPFPSSPLLNTQTHKYMTYRRMHTPAHAPPSRSLTRRAPTPHSKSKRLMWFLGQNEIVCHYKALHYRTPEKLN